MLLQKVLFLLDINNRIIVQWLSYTHGNVTNGSNVRRNLPTTFSSSAFCIVGSMTNTPLNYSRYNPAYILYNNSQITIVYWMSSDASLNIQNLRVSCVVIGY